MKSLRTRTFVAGVLALAVVVILVALAQSADRDGSKERFGDGTDAEAALDDAIATLEPEARELWPDAFAGTWGDKEGRIHIAFTEGAEEKLDMLSASFPARELLVAETHEHSMEELEAKQLRMGEDRELAKGGEFQLQGVPGGQYNLDIDPERNAIVVLVEAATPIVDEAFKSRYGEDVVIEKAPLGGPFSCMRSRASPC